MSSTMDDDNFLKVVGYSLLFLYTMALINFPMWTLGISFILFIIACAISFLYHHISKGTFDKLRHLYPRRYNRISEINSKYPHSLKIYCSQNKIDYKTDIYGYSLKEALMISKTSKEKWEIIEREALIALEKEYKTIEEKYPYGLALAIAKYNNRDHEFLIGEKSFIFHQQRLYDDEILFDQWEVEQRDFHKEFLKALSTCSVPNKKYTRFAELEKIDRYGVASKCKYDVLYACEHETTTSNEIPVSDLDFEWETFRDYISNCTNDSDYAFEYNLISIIRSLNNYFKNKITFVITDINADLLLKIVNPSIPPRQTALIGKLRAEGIDAIELQTIFGFDHLNNNRVVVVSNILTSSDLQRFIKAFQDARKRDKICMACISCVVDHNPAFAKILIAESKKREQVMHTIHDFHESVKNNSVEDIKKNYQKAIDLIEPDEKLQSFMPALNIIKDKYKEFEKTYSEGIICNQDIISVEFTTPIEYIFQDTTKYWFVLFPKPQTKIFPFRRRKVNRRGYAEEQFEIVLRNYLTNTSVIPDAALFISENCQYEPDIAIIYKNDYQINIDIEIDEPYSGYDHQPIHIANCAADQYRDQLFVNAGWIVIRFAEEQVVKTPLNCVLAIARVLHAIDCQYVINKKLQAQIDKSEEDLKLIPKWSYEDAMAMASSNYREKYLGISTFGKVDNQQYDPSDIQISELEKKLSSELPAIDICPPDYEIAIYNEKVKNTSIDLAKQTLTEKQLSGDCFKKPQPKERVRNRHIISIDPIVNSQQLTTGVLSIYDLMRYYFRSINHSYIAELKSHGDEHIANSIFKALAIEEKKRTYIYKQLSEIVNSNPVRESFEVQYNGQYLTDVDVSKEIHLIREFIKSKGVKPDVAGIEVLDKSIDLVAPIGCLYGSELFDFDIYTEYRGLDRGRSVLTHLGDVPNERNDMTGSLKALMLENHLNLQIKTIYTVTIDVKNNEYRIRRVRRRTSEAQNVLRELLLNPLKPYEKL